MTMAWNIENLRKSGDSADATLADMLQLRLEARGDFKFPADLGKIATGEVITLKTSIDEPIDSQNMTAEILPVMITNTELARVSFGNLAHRETPITSPEAINNNVDLKRRFSEVLAPYVLGVNTEVQNAKILKGFIKESEHKWQDTQILDNELTNVFFKAPYRSHDTYNEALGLEVVYSDRDKPHKNDLHIELVFKNGGVDTVTLAIERNPASGFGHTGRSTFQTLMYTVPGNEVHMPKDNDHWSEGILKGGGFERGMTHTFYLQENVVKVISKSQYNLRTITRTFNAETNMFDSTYQRSDDKLPTVTNRSLDPDTVVSFIDGLLASLPRRNEL